MIWKELVIKALFVVDDENIGKGKQLVIGIDHFEPYPGSQAERGYDGYEHDDEREAAHKSFLDVLLNEQDGHCLRAWLAQAVDGYGASWRCGHLDTVFLTAKVVGHIPIVCLRLIRHGGAALHILVHHDLTVAVAADV